MFNEEYVSDDMKISPAANPTSAGDEGAQFEGYNVVKLLGAGRQAETYLARDGAGNLVAIKAIRPERARSKQARIAMDIEVQAMRAVCPAYVPQVSDYRPNADRPYVVMEYISGETLDEALSRHAPLTDAQLHRLAVKVAAVASAIHGAGVAHGDLRGQNLILGQGGIYAVDFGKAVLRGAGQHEYRKKRRWDMVHLGGIIACAGTGRQPFGEEQYQAIKHFAERRADLGTLSGPLRVITHTLLTHRRRPVPSARTVRRWLIRGRVPWWRPLLWSRARR